MGWERVNDRLAVFSQFGDRTSVYIYLNKISQPIFIVEFLAILTSFTVNLIGSFTATGSSDRQNGRNSEKIRIFKKSLWKKILCSTLIEVFSSDSNLIIKQKRIDAYEVKQTNINREIFWQKM